MKTGDGASKSTQCLGTGPGLAEGMQGSTSPGNEASTMAAIGATNGIVREELQRRLETPMPPTALAGRAAVHLVPLAVARLPSTVRQARLPQARAPLVCERHAGLEREELQRRLETPMPPTALAGRAAVHLVPLAVARLPSTVRQARLPHARAPLVCERHAGLER
eukprot:jgi/Undpi1/2977/HiC_scaffold_14.g06354.m1